MRSAVIRESALKITQLFRHTGPLIYFDSLIYSKDFLFILEEQYYKSKIIGANLVLLVQNATFLEVFPFVGANRKSLVLVQNTIFFEVFPFVRAKLKLLVLVQNATFLGVCL